MITRLEVFSAAVEARRATAVTERVKVCLPDGFDADRHDAALARLIGDPASSGSFEVRLARCTRPPSRVSRQPLAQSFARLAGMPGSGKTNLLKGAVASDVRPDGSPRLSGDFVVPGLPDELGE